MLRHNSWTRNQHIKWYHFRRARLSRDKSANLIILFTSCSHKRTTKMMAHINREIAENFRYRKKINNHKLLTFWFSVWNIHIDSQYYTSHKEILICSAIIYIFSNSDSFEQFIPKLQTFLDRSSREWDSNTVCFIRSTSDRRKWWYRHTDRSSERNIIVFDCRFEYYIVVIERMIKIIAIMLSLILFSFFD